MRNKTNYPPRRHSNNIVSVTHGLMVLQRGPRLLRPTQSWIPLKSSRLLRSFGSCH